MHCCLVLCLGVSVIVFVLMHIFPEQIFYLFGVKADVLTYGLPYIYAFSFEYIGLPFIMSFNTVSTATGNGWITLVANLVSAFLVRIPLASVSYTHLIRFIRQAVMVHVPQVWQITILSGTEMPQSGREPTLTGFRKISMQVKPNSKSALTMRPDSYTHLDVYKRQVCELTKTA